MVDGYAKGRNKGNDIIGGDASAEKGKDKGWGKRKEEQEEALSRIFEDATLDGEGNLRGATHREHEDRRAKIGLAEFNDKDVGREGRGFAISSNVADAIDGSPVNHYKMLGISDADRLFAEAPDAVSNNFLAPEGVLTNEAIKMDNYEFLLNNTSQIKMTIAKSLLAKMDYDEDLRGTLNDLLAKDGYWADKSPEVIFAKLQNELRNKGKAHNSEYRVILNMFNHLDELDTKNREYKKLRQESMFAILDEIEDRDLHKLLNDSTIEDKKVEQQILQGLEFLSYEFSPQSENEGKISLDDYLNSASQRGQESPMPPELSKLVEALEEADISLGSVPVDEVVSNYKNYIENKKLFTENHNFSFSLGNDIADRFASSTPLYPTAYLARWADKEFFENNYVDNAGEGETFYGADKADEDFKKSLVHTLKARGVEVTDELLSDILSNLESDLSKNKRDFESLYNPDKDAQNPHRKYIPFESQKNHEQSQNIFRDSLHLAINKSLYPEDFEKFYTEEDEQKIISSVLNKELEEKKPNADKVNDLMNAINILTKATSATINDIDLGRIIDSPIFEDNAYFNKEDVAQLKSYGKDLSIASETVKERDIYGLPDMDIIRERYQELVYLDVADNLVSRLRNPEGIKDTLKQNFFQNNKAYRNLEVCMEGAKNPTTSFETVPSLGKACFDKLEEEYTQDAEKARQATSNQANAMAGMSLIGGIMAYMTIQAQAGKDMVGRIKAEINEVVAKEMAYVENSVNQRQASARNLNVFADELGIASQIVDEAFAEKVAEEAESEHTIREVVEYSAEKLKRDVETGMSESELGNLIEKSIEENFQDTVGIEADKERRILIRSKEALERAQETLLLEEKAYFEREVEKSDAPEHLKERFFEIEEELSANEDFLNSDTSSVPANILSQAKLDAENKKKELEELKKKLYEEIGSAPASPSHKNAIEAVEHLELKIKEGIEKEKELRSQIKETNSVKDSLLSRFEYNSQPKNLSDGIKSKAKMLATKFPFGIKDQSIEGRSVGKINMENLSREERNLLITVLAKRRDTIQSAQLEILAGKTTYAEVLSRPELKGLDEKDLDKEINKIGRVLPVLHREALSDKDNFAEALRDGILIDYHFRISDGLQEEIRNNGLNIGKHLNSDNLIKEIGGMGLSVAVLAELKTKVEENSSSDGSKILEEAKKLGLDDNQLTLLEQKIKENTSEGDNFGKIMEEGEKKGLSDRQLSSLRGRLSEYSRSMRELDPKIGKISLPSGSGTLSTLLALYSKSNNPTGKVISDSNDFYATTSTRLDGRAFVKGGKGIEGLLLAEMELALKKKDWDEVNKLAIAGDSLNVKGNLSSEQEKDILGKLAKGKNDLDQANAYVGKMINEKSKNSSVNHRVDSSSKQTVDSRKYKSNTNARSHKEAYKKGVGRNW